MTGPLVDIAAQRVVLATEDDPLSLRGGGSLAHVEVVYETYGDLSPARDNVVFVCHALTGDAHAAGLRPGETRPGWWDRLIGPGKAIDTDRFFVVSPNLLGGCSGTTGPQSVDPATGTPYFLDFPQLHMTDLVAVHRRLLAHLGIERLHAAVGGSLGGMQVLQWVIDDPAQVERAVLVGASSRLSAENIAFSSVARAAIMNDPEFHHGRYAEHGVVPRHGLKVARMMAHITYVSGESLRGEVRAPPRLGRRRLALRPRLRRRALPAPPGRVVPRSLRRPHLPLPHPPARLLRPLRRPLDRRPPRHHPHPLPAHLLRLRLALRHQPVRPDGRAARGLRRRGRPRRALLPPRPRLLPPLPRGLPRPPQDTSSSRNPRWLRCEERQRRATKPSDPVGRARRTPATS